MLPHSLMSQPGECIYRFADIEVLPSQGCLTRGGETQYLRQKTFQVLLYLLAARERLVTKEELIARVWEGTAVTDDSLVKCIVDIRKALGDDSHRPRFIKTLPKVGYHFIGAVEECWIDERAIEAVAAQPAVEMEEVTFVQIDERETSEIEKLIQRRRDIISPRLLPPISPSPRLRIALSLILGVMLVIALAVYWGVWRWAPERSLAQVVLSPAPGKKPLAVMYFENQSGDRELDWLREGLADMLITDLARSKKLNVLSRQQLHLLLERIGHQRAEAIRLDEALTLARKGQAEVVMLGSFAKLGEKVRINVQLYDVRSGQVLASESLVADRADQILAQMDLLSLKLTTHLGVAPAENETKIALASAMTKSLDAYRYYSLALEQAQALHHAEAIALLEKAVALDPQFAMAHARIGYVYAVTWGLAEKGKPHLEKAFHLADRLTEKDRLYINAWYAIANLDYPGAAQTLRQMIAQYPTEIEAYWRLGRLLLGEEQYEDAVSVLKQALVVDAEAKDVYNALGVTYRDMGRHHEAIAMSERYVQLAPNEPNARDSLALAYQGAGLYDKALAEYERALSLNPEFEVAILHLGNLYFQLGRYAEALRHYQRYIAIASSDWDRAWGHGRLAWVYWRKGDLRQAAAAARKELSYEKSAVGNSLIIALASGDQKTARSLEQQLLVQGPYTERGLRPALRSLYFFQGYLARTNGRSAEAVQHFKEVLKHRPLIWDIDSFEDCLANAYLELGRMDEAIAEYERILRLNPNYPLAQYHLGQAYERKGEQARARAAYERFLQIWKDADPDIPEVRAAKTSLDNRP